ncbi:MAG: hypothetical protein M3067_15685 [Chloroflexota bacterium]|nr:hypothetical protein [Chloroflexota bacterium]
MRARTLGVLLAVALLTPGSAAAQSRVLGSPLTAEPNVNLGCETRLALGDDGGTGTYYASPSGQPDCTWRQSGVFGVTDYNVDSRTSSVPATGRITNVAVRSGPNPGLIRFVIMRQLAAGGSGGEQGGSYCCYAVEEGPVVRPNPNTITNFATNFLVVRNVDSNGVLAVDHIGVSGVAGTGSLPLHSTGRNNSFQFTEPGSVNAAFFYPRLGGQPSDASAGRREEGVPGFEMLIRWTWCPAGATCGDVAVPPTQLPGGATAGADRPTGTPGADRICGLGGNDTINELRGNDTIFGDRCSANALAAIFAPG